MPEIRPSSDLRNKYNEIAQFCHEHSEPVYLTKNGKGDLAVMSIDTYEMLTGRFELYNLLAKGEEAIKKGKSIPADEAFKRIENGLSE